MTEHKTALSFEGFFVMSGVVLGCLNRNKLNNFTDLLMIVSNERISTLMTLWGKA